MPARKAVFAVSGALLAVAIAVVAIEGLYSLGTGRSAARRVLGESPGEVRQRMTHEERLKAALLTEGPYAVALDPDVSMRLKGGFRYEFHGVEATTDEWGMRRRPGLEPEEGARRIVVLGDSVAFGFGVADDETYASRLESTLATAATGPRPAVFTVACPGWSFVNSSTYLLDHLDRLRPDVVVFIPVANDLDNAYGVLETGHRSVDNDPAVGVAEPRAALDFHHRMLSGLRALLGRDIERADSHTINWALTSGVSPESVRRYRRLVDGLEDLRARLEARGAHLLVCMPSNAYFEDRVHQFLAAASSEVEVCGLFGAVDASHQLDGDPHFNAGFIAAGARRLARELARRGWLPGIEEQRLPAPDPRHEGNVYRLRGRDELLAEKVAVDRRMVARFGGEVRLPRGVGYNQVYGGLWPDATMGIAAMMTLRRDDARKLRVVVRRHDGHPATYPLTLEIEVNGAALEPAVVPSIEQDSRPNLPFVRDLPADVREAGFVDVKLRASHRAATRFQEIDLLASVRVIHVELR